MQPTNIENDDVEARVLQVLVPLNQALAEFARRGVTVRLAPWGGLYEAHIYTGKNLIVLRPDIAPPPPANDLSPGQ